ncbi:hypothetical protein [Rhodococcus sp. B10]|uniref:hypothetical protein n=1 Tax=Rhodococcus sp. B10 TaxID=2695876 RepID=UPI001431C6CD|nr:hypothetical protein [Rhodococcus sp. B10]NIL76792.1 hypothetical protein [Rhodococcus sp. B10]
MPFKGTKGENLSITIDAEEYNSYLHEVRAEPDDGEDSDFITFANAASGDTSQWFLRGTMYNDYASDSLWTKAWENSGQVVPFVIKPYGNAAPSEDQPHFRGDVKISRKPGVGGEANEAHETEIEWEIDGVPERVVA